MKILLTIFFFFFLNFSYTQNWLQTGGGASHDEAFDVETDAQGNIYTTGYVSSTSQMGTTVNIQTSGFSDIYVSKSNASGDFLWAKTFGGPGADRGYDIDVDNIGNIYVTGYVTGTVTFDSFTIITNNNSQDFFVAKLNPDGDVLWVNVQGGTDGEVGFGIAVDSQSNVVVTGQFKGNSTIGAETVTSTWNPDDNEFSTDIFIVKYAANGTSLWTRTGVAIYDDRGIAVDINNNDEILLTGQFSDTLLIAGETYNNDIVNAGYLLKMDQSGNNIWFRTMGAYQTMVYDVEVDDERVYVTGDYLGQMAIFGGTDVAFLTGDYQYKIFVVRFDQSGNVAWTQTDASDSQISSKAITLDSNRDVYISGVFKCQFTEYADSLGGNGYFNSVGYRDIFISKYHQDGSREWVRQFGGPGQDYCSGIAINQIDNPIVAGSYEVQFAFPINLSSFNDNANNHMLEAGNCGSFNYYQSVFSTGFKDVFVTQPVNLNVDQYYYYIADCFNALLPEISNQDSLNFCGEGALSVQTFTEGNGDNAVGHVGPYFSFDWNIGNTESYIDIQNSGWYSCQIDRIDGCTSTLDSVFIQVNPIPSVPPMTDELGINITSLNYSDILACFPDSVWVTFDVDTLLSNSFMGNSFTYQDTIEITTEGLYSFVVENEFGCSMSKSFDFAYVNAQLDTMVPYLTLPSGLDSIVICENSSVTLNCLDLITNPLADPLIPFETFVVPGFLTELDTTFYPSSSGWYEITYHPILGYNNICGAENQPYEVSTSIYVTINPNPVVSLTLDGISPFCPGDTTNIWASNTYSGLSWSGPGIVEINETGDSILAIEVGAYHYNGNVVDPITGCNTNVNNFFLLNYKDDPNIWSNVPDNLICPGDSLLLTCDPGLEYTWVGPMGQVIGNTQSIWVDLPGFYHCVLLDFDGCLLTSNTLELLEYNSPYLLPEPGTELCHTGSIEITVMHSGSPVFYWLDPINSTASVVVLEDPGTYVCEISQCGFTVTDSVTIEDSGFQAVVEAVDTLLCEGEDFVLTANDAMATYEWSNGIITLNNQMVVSEPGEYSVFM